MPQLPCMWFGHHKEGFLKIPNVFWCPLTKSEVNVFYCLPLSASALLCLSIKIDILASSSLYIWWNHQLFCRLVFNLQLTGEAQCFGRKRFSHHGRISALFSALFQCCSDCSWQGQWHQRVAVHHLSWWHIHLPTALREVGIFDRLILNQFLSTLQGALSLMCCAIWRLRVTFASLLCSLTPRIAVQYLWSLY